MQTQELHEDGIFRTVTYFRDFLESLLAAQGVLLIKL